MHEYSVVQALLNQCEEVAEENDAEKITKVVCKIGVMSGIENHLLQVAFDTFKEGTMCAEAEFIVNEQRLKLECRDCGHVFETDEIRYYCTECESLRVKVLDGEDMYLMSLEME
ncbi:hydrogenase/urease nickel incorporation protein HypA [Sulfurovum sp. NBC37-1]|uniref:hydrogenase/urease nickel incorporation protein HypA n=1 Tax=Sulfurovum sp. (strain NBC37-1) TaxID=387093 RepID=UPI0001587CDA|nr:hydrogenase/urease nickel incorporation protein HypA [Sulfurovum sp. NBC37-1]BAF72594.1 hydrogenase expression/synthesis protein HypA [Sulfurovum sp. NBC37-1]